MRYPEPIAPGDLVAVVAPASPFGRDEFFRGLAWLRGRYRLRVATSVLSRDGYLAGDDTRRAGELAAAMVDPEVRAIVAARGGYGVTRIVGDLPWGAWASSPKWLVGFSDITALHAHAWHHGVASVHGPNVTGLGAASPWSRWCWMQSLERPRAPRTWAGLDVLRQGEATGPIVGGNLSLLEALAAAGRLDVPDGAILALEDVTERPYRIDRMLTSLRLGGYLQRAAGIVVGGFTRCEAGPDGITVDRVLRDRLGDLGVPVVAGAPFGHDAVNDAFVMGARVSIAGASVTWSVDGD